MYNIGMCAELDSHVRWLLGDGIAFVEHPLTGQWRQKMTGLPPIPGCRHDDFQSHDPLPLLGEAVDCFSKFVAVREAVRPMKEGMVP